MKGQYSLPKSENPFSYESVHTSGLWTEVEFSRNLFLQLEGAVDFFEKYVDVYFAKYSVSSAFGFYF